MYVKIKWKLFRLKKNIKKKIIEKKKKKRTQLIIDQHCDPLLFDLSSMILWEKGLIVESCF